MLKKRFDDMIDSFDEKALFSGVVYLNQRDVEIYSKAVGFANRQYHCANDVAYQYATASITKMFTAVGILQLVETGMVKLDTLVVDYLNLEDSLLPKECTVKHLLTHTSGISDYYNEEDPDGFEMLWHDVPCNAVDSLRKMLPFFIDENPKHELGDRFSYNGAGFILLGLIIEKATDMDYFEYIQSQVFLKADMKNTNFVCLDEVKEGVAEGYILIKDRENHVKEYRRNVYAVPAYGLSDGGAFSTAKDLVSFMKALRTGKLISKYSVDKYLKPMVKVSKNWQYGYGFWFDVEDGILLRYGHTGEDPGVSARVFYYPELDLDFIVLGNISYCAGNLTWQLHQIILEEIADYKENIKQGM